MRKTSAVLASLSLAVLALTGCAATASSGATDCERDTSDSILSVANITGDLGDAPDVEVFAPVNVEESAFADVTVGDGEALTTEFQPMVLDIAFYAGETGEKIYASEFNGDLSRVHSSDYWAQRSPGLADVLECATGGSRILAVLTPDDFGAQNVEGFGLKKNENVVAVIDILDVYLPRAEGALQFNDAQGMPTVVRAPDGTPGIIIPDSAAPEDAVTQTLIKGDGPEVKKGDVVFTNVAVADWDTKKVESTTWGAEPSSGAASEQLVGATVGSQLLIVIPASEGAAAKAVVVDILGVAPAPTP